MALFGNEDLNWQVIQGTSGSGNAGTTVVKNGPGHLGGIYVGIPSTGSISYYDCNTGTGTTAGNLILTIANNGTKVPDLFQTNCVVRFGLIAVTSVGTTNQTVFWN